MKRYWFFATDKCLASTIINKKKKERTQSVQKNEQGTITDLRH